MEPQAELSGPYRLRGKGKFSTRHEHIVTKFYGFNGKGCVSRDLCTQFYESQINQPIIRPQLTFLFYNI